jgi:hypothetical protein
MKMQHDDFENWIRERAGACVEPEVIDELCKGDLDFDSGEYTFRNAGVQAQWAAWQAALLTVKPPYGVPNIHDSIRQSYRMGELNVEEAARVWYQHGHTNHVDIEYAERQLGEQLLLETGEYSRCANCGVVCRSQNMLRPFELITDQLVCGEHCAECMNDKLVEP